MPVYFVQAGPEGLIKIGFTSNPKNRIKNLRTACPGMRLLAILDGDKAVEASLHKRFSSAVIEREWFSPSPEILEFIAGYPGVIDPTSRARRGPKTHPSNHPLATWMDSTGTTDADLAARLEGITGAKVDRSTVSRLRRGKRMPSPEMMRAIYAATDGRVSANDFVHVGGEAGEFLGVPAPAPSVAA